MTSFDDLISQLNRFSKKHHAILTLKGGLLFCCYTIVLGFFIGLLELFFRFPTYGRLILFYGALLILLVFFSSLVLIPLCRYLGVLKRLGHSDAARLIGGEIKGINDKLLNTIQLAKQQKNFNSPNLILLSASINQRSKELNSFSFSDAVSFKRNKTFILAFLVLVGISSFVSILNPSIIISPLSRVIHFNDTYIPDAPYLFVVNNNHKLEVLENEDLNITITSKGETNPKLVYLYCEDQRLLPVKVNQKTFSYSFKNVQKNFSFIVSDGVVNSKDFNVSLLPKASLSGLQTILSYPSYTQIPTDTIYDFQNFEIPLGTTMFFHFNTKNTSKFNVCFKDSVFSYENLETNQISFNYAPKNSQDFYITNHNNFSNYCDSNKSNIVIIKDAFPKIRINEFCDSSFLLQKFFDGKIDDDYGISKLTFNYSLNKEMNRIEIPLISQQSNFFAFDFNFQTINYNPGDVFSYYFEVWDNDGINGPKSVKSIKKNLNTPTVKEQNLAEQKARENTIDAFSKVENKVEKLNNELKNIKADLLSKKEMSWNDKSRLQSFLNDQKSLEKSLKKIQQEMTKKLQLSEKSEEILEKQKLLEKMMSELMSDEMKKLYDEMSKLLDEMNKNDLLEKIDEAQMSQDNLLKELDRSLEHFKRLEVENKAEKIAEKLVELSKDQRSLEQKTKDKDQSLFDLTKEQNKIQSEFFEIQNELSELNEMNNELESPKDLNKENEEKEINEAMKKSEEDLESGKRKKASENQKNAAKQMDELASSLNKVSSSSEQEEEDAESLRQLLENLISFSLEQEDLLKTLKTLSTQDPKYIGVGQNQRKLKDDVKIIEDSLDALGKRQIMISNLLNKEIQEIKRSLNFSIKNITERKKNIARSNQHNVMMHTNELALLLSEMLKQMQNNMSGTGQCNKPGGKGKKSGKSLSQNAEQMKKQIEKMKKMLSEQKGNKKGMGKPSFEQLGRLAAEQAAIKKQLMELAQELNKDGSGKGNGINKMIKEIEKTEEEIINNNFDLSSIVRQEEIKVQLLELEKALKEQDQQKERESKEGKKKEEKNLNNKFEEYQRLKQREVDLLKTIPPNLKPYYKNKVNEYFNSLEN